VYLFVDLFFVLSGFILTLVYRDAIASASQLRRFLILRFFRIYPVHVAMLLLLGLIELLKIAAAVGGFAVPNHPPFIGPRSPESFLAHLFLLQGSGLVADSWNMPSWSIGCEAIAYILFGAVTLVGVLKWRGAVPVAMLVSVATYGLLVALRGDLESTFDLGLMRCIGGFLLGLSVAVYVSSEKGASALATLSDRTLSTITTSLFGLAALLLCLVEGYSVLLLLPVFALLVLFLQGDRGVIARLLRSRVFAFLGLVSYSIYMVHYPFFMLLEPVFNRTVTIGEWSGDILLAVSLTAVILMAWASYTWIEAPGREVGRQIAQKFGAQSRDATVLGIRRKPAS
jgi:peptidoglycan/LPS O-acetylase OafA/YrhL